MSSKKTNIVGFNQKKSSIPTGTRGIITFPQNATLNNNLLSHRTQTHHNLPSPSNPTRRQRPIKPTGPIHILPILRLLRLINAIILIVARHLSILRAAKTLEPQQPLHLRLAVLILHPILHLHIARRLPILLSSPFGCPFRSRVVGASVQRLPRRCSVARFTRGWWSA